MDPMGTAIEPSSISCKLLGVNIDEHLNFNIHVASLCKKISKQIAVMSRFRKLVKCQNYTIVNLRCIRPIIMYYLTSLIAPPYGRSKTAPVKLEKTK